MQTDIPNLFVEINEKNYIFVIGKYSDDKNFKVIDEIIVPNNEFINGKLINISKIKDKVKKNVQLIESKLNFVFQDIILLLDNFIYILSRIGGPKGKTFIKIYTQSYFLREKINLILLIKPKIVHIIFWKMKPSFDAISHNLKLIKQCTLISKPSFRSRLKCGSNFNLCPAATSKG